MTKTKTKAAPSLMDRLATQTPIKRGPVSFAERLPADLRDELTAVARRWRSGELRRSSDQIREAFLAILAERGIIEDVSHSHFNSTLRKLSK